MPPFAGLSDTQIWQLVAYLRSLHSPSSTAAAASTASGDAAAGETLFFGRAACASCHEVNARGGIVGPDLSNAGRLSPAVLQQKIVNPNGPGAAISRRARRRPWRHHAGDGDREDAGRPRDSRGPPQRGYVLAADDRCGWTAADVRQAAAVICRGRQHVAAPAGLRDPLIGRRDREPGGVSAHAAGTGPEQDRVRAAGSRRCDLRAPPHCANRASQLADVLGRLPGHTLFRADEHRYDERGPASSRVVGAGARRQRQREHPARRRRRDVCDERRQHANGHRDGRADRAADSGDTRVSRKSAIPGRPTW